MENINKLSKVTILTMFLILLFITLSSVNAADININNSTSGGISGAVNNTSVDTIYLASGNYTGLNNTNISINRTLTIIGNNKKNTIINAENLNRIFNIISTGNLILINITLINGNTTDYYSSGGAIYNNGGKLTMTNCILSNNTSNDHGGAIYTSKGETILNNCILINNSAGASGAAAFFENSNLMINNSIFIDNIAIYAGGAFVIDGYGNYNCIATINNCNFTNNNATYYGGAIG